MIKSLSTLSLNVGSLVATQRRLELQQIIKENIPDIFFLQETHLSPTHKLNIERYTIYRNDNDQGTAVAIRSNFPAKRIFIPNLSIPYTCIKVDMRQNRQAKTFIYVSLYIPCRITKTNFTANLDALASFSEQFSGAIIGGDLNAKNTAWGDNCTNANGAFLFSWMTDSTSSLMRLCSTEPTYPNGSSFLDHFLVSAHLINIFNINFEISTKASFADHFALMLKIRMPFTDFIPSPEHPRKRQIINWKVYQELVSNDLSELLPPCDKNISNEDIDMFSNFFSEIIVACKNRASITENFRNYSPYFNLVIKTLIKIKHRWQRKLKKIYHRQLNRTSPEYVHISNKIHSVSSIIKDQIRRAKNENFQKFLEDLPPNPSSFRKIYSFLSIKSNSFCSELNTGTNVIYDKKAIANKFLAHFANIYRENIPQHSATSEIASFLAEKFATISDSIAHFSHVSNALGQNRISEHFITVDAVQASLKALNNKKSFGPDEVPNALLKNLPESGIHYLTIVFNHCINNGYFPSIWKVAKIIPIKKRAQASTSSTVWVQKRALDL